jgi:hypothetical protein
MTKHLSFANTCGFFYNKKQRATPNKQQKRIKHKNGKTKTFFFKKNLHFLSRQKIVNTTETRI